MTRWLALAALLLFPALAQAAPALEPPDCGKSGNWNSRCDWMAAGELDLPAVLARGDEVIRIQGLSSRIWGDYLMELRHPHAGGYQLVIRNPYARDAAIMRPVARRDWDALSRMRTAMLTSHLQYAPPAPGYESICVDSPGVAIDSVLHGATDHFETFDCTFPAIGAFFRRAPAALYRLVPDCMKLRVGFRSFCGSLRGDMDAARAAVPYLAIVTYWSCAPRDADEVDPDKLLAPGATLTVADSTGVAAGTWRGPEIGKTLCDREFDFRPHRIIGQGAQVRVEGIVRRTWDEPSITQGAANAYAADAPSVQVWHLDHGAAALESWTVGVFGPPYK